MKSTYSVGTRTSGPEALFKEAYTQYSGISYGAGNTGVTPEFSIAGDPLTGIISATSVTATGGWAPFGGMERQIAEALGESGTTSGDFNSMAFTIDRASVTAKTRALKAEYTIELAQDLKAIHGLDAETELANILSTEILAEINREVVRSIYATAKLGAQHTDLKYTQTGNSYDFGGGLIKVGGVYDLLADSDGRWSAEKFRGLMFQIEREANVIAKDTRRGKGNFIICSADVASALAMGGFLQHSMSTLMSMTLATPLLVFSMARPRFMLTHTRVLVSTPMLATSCALDTREPRHMTQVSSIALTSHYRWFVQSIRRPSNRRSDSRLDTEWQSTPSSTRRMSRLPATIARTCTTASSAWTTSTVSMPMPSRLADS